MSDATYRHSFEQSGVGMALLSLRTAVSELVNSALCDLLGYPREALLEDLPGRDRRGRPASQRHRLRRPVVRPGRLVPDDSAMPPFRWPCDLGTSRSPLSVTVGRDGTSSPRSSISPLSPKRTRAQPCAGREPSAANREADRRTRRRRRLPLDHAARHDRPGLDFVVLPARPRTRRRLLRLRLDRRRPPAGLPSRRIRPRPATGIAGRVDPQHAAFAVPAHRDPAVPEQTLETLNNLFRMDSQSDLYFTIWYGIFQNSTGTLRYSSAGAPPALLPTQIGTGKQVRPVTLATPVPTHRSNRRHLSPKTSAPSPRAANC